MPSRLSPRAGSARRPTGAGLIDAGRRTATVLFLAVVPLVVLAWTLVLSWRDGEFAVDFHHELYLQARGLLENGVAFDSPDVVIDGTNLIFPPLATFAATPLAVLPATGADIVMTALLIVAAAATLWVLEVRDWRVYAVTALWPPFLSGVQTANVTLILGLLAALAWRYRDRRLLPGVLVGLAIGLKLFPWPLVIWLAATRRFAAAAAACAVSAASLVLVTPFGSPLDYIRLIRRLGDAMEENGYSVYALLGGGMGARAANVAVAIASVALVVIFRRDDRRSLTCAILACLLCTPILWLHYLQLLIVPLAIARPRLSPLWLVPLVTWLVPFGYAEPWQITLVLIVTASLVVGLLRTGQPTARVRVASPPASATKPSLP